jgi:hypothetical protein
MPNSKVAQLPPAPNRHPDFRIVRINCDALGIIIFEFPKVRLPRPRSDAVNAALRAERWAIFATFSFRSTGLTRPAPVLRRPGFYIVERPGRTESEGLRPRHADSHCPSTNSCPDSISFLSTHGPTATDVTSTNMNRDFTATATGTQTYGAAIDTSRSGSTTYTFNWTNGVVVVMSTITLAHDLFPQAISSTQAAAEHPHL